MVSSGMSLDRWTSRKETVRLLTEPAEIPTLHRLRLLLSKMVTPNASNEYRELPLSVFQCLIHSSATTIIYDT